MAEDTFDGCGQLETVKDAAGNIWRHSYDQRGRKIDSVDPYTRLYARTGQVEGCQGAVNVPGYHHGPPAANIGRGFTYR